MMGRRREKLDRTKKMIQECLLVPRKWLSQACGAMRGSEHSQGLLST